jgi:hypothetical protein
LQLASLESLHSDCLVRAFGVVTVVDSHTEGSGGLDQEAAEALVNGIVAPLAQRIAEFGQMLRETQRDLVDSNGNVSLRLVPELIRSPAAFGSPELRILCPALFIPLLGRAACCLGDQAASAGRRAHGRDRIAAQGRPSFHAACSPFVFRSLCCVLVVLMAGAERSQARRRRWQRSVLQLLYVP